MAKYFVSLVLLAFLALENNSIYSRTYAKSYSSDGSNNNLQLQQHQPHHHKHKHRQYPHQQHNHHHNAHQQQQHISGDYSEEEAVSMRQVIQRLRHYERQLEHQQQHKQQHYQQQQRIAAANAAVAMTNKHMYGDAPAAATASADNSRESRMEDENLFAQLPPNLQDSDETGYKDDFASGESSEKSTGSSSSSYGRTATPAPMRCPKCENSRAVEHISEEELTRLRIEFVKQQILEKLRLKERPNVSPVALPKPIYEGTTSEHEDTESKNKELDDYYAKTSMKFIFLKREERECQQLGPHPSVCFSFKIDDADADSFDVDKAVLWLFKNKQNSVAPRNSTGLSEQQTIVVSEVQQQLDSKYLPMVKTLAIKSVDVQDKWLKIDLRWPTKRWFGSHDLSHLIHISCQTCDIDSMEKMISVDKEFRPFIMVNMQNRKSQQRSKRSINCTDGVTECCRERLYISFDEIGWGDWIIQPRGYDAYFCRGSCGSVASVAQASSHHSTFLQKVLSTQRSNGRQPLELIPCCTPKKYSSLQLVFMDSNNTATQKTFPNMVVESCGCR